MCFLGVFFFFSAGLSQVHEALELLSLEEGHPAPRGKANALDASGSRGGCFLDPEVDAAHKNHFFFLLRPSKTAGFFFFQHEPTRGVWRGKKDTNMLGVLGHGGMGESCENWVYAGVMSLTVSGVYQSEKWVIKVSS